VLGRAWGALRARRLTMDSLIALGALSAYFYSLAAAAAGKPLVYFDGACGLIAFRLLGRLIEQTAFRRASVAAEAVRRLLPRRARRIEAESGLVRWVPATDLRRGDAIRVAPGERLPVDGRVLRGSGRVSTAAVDGEPRPRRVVAGDLVPGGSSCGESALELEVEAPAAESLLSRIADHVARASGQRPGGRDLADALARRLLPAVLVLAAATVAGWLAIGLVPGEALRRGLSVLVVCCPCALGMAGPLARVIAGGTLARRGIIVRGEGALDLAATARAVVFDKTGTLTRGELRACAITVEGASEVVALEALAALEKPSDHPVARAVRASTTGDRHEVANAEVLEGRGVRGVLDGVPAVAGKPSWVRDSVGALASGIEQAVASEEAKGRTVVIVAWGEVQAAVSFGDALRPEAAGVTAQLAAAGLPVTVLSGDAEAPTARIACAVGAAEHRGGCRPEEKVSHLARIAQRTGARPIFVGDGINDAPALAASTGVAVATGTDFARETADVLLLRPGLDALPELVSIARRMRSVIRQNLAWAALYNVIAIPAAVLGHLDPILAAAAMVASSVLTTLNSTRLARHPRSAPADAPTGEPLWSCAP
jgi:heavy metal translocating P-type ATPase